MQERSDFSKSMAASVVLHLGLLAAVLFLKPWTRQLPPGAVVPVTIVSNAAVTDLRAAEEADKVQQAQTDEPVPEAAPEPAAAPTPAPTPQPQPKPTPTPPKPAPPTPTPAPPKPVPPKPSAQPQPKPVEAKPTPPAPSPAKPAAKPAAKPEKSLDLDALAASIAKSSKTAGGKASSAAKGPAQRETALQARDAAGAGKGLSANALAGLAGELQRRWNPNCEVEGGRDVKVRVTFTLGSGGQVVGQVDAGGLDQSPNPVIKAAADRAIRAVHQAAPFSPQYSGAFGQKVAVNFNAREACS